MTKRVKANGESLMAALRSAIAEIAGTEEDKVELSVNVPGLDPEAEQPTRVRFEISEPPTEEESADASEPAGGSEDTGESGDGSSGGGHELTVEDLDEEADAAADFLEGLLDVMELPGDLQIRVHEDHAEVEMVNVGGGTLIGRRGSTLEAIQELLRSVLQREFQRRAHVKIDVEGYRARRIERYLEKAEEAIEEVLDTGEPVRLEPMDVFERKQIHHLAAERDGVTSRSQGREPGRRVVIEPE